jgi:hypothetical protein
MMTILTKHHVKKTKVKPFAKLLMAASIVTLAAVTLPANAATSDWNPLSSERLVKLPGNYVDKALQQDFLASPLAADLTAVTDNISGQHQTLAQLRNAIGSAEGEELVELRHQYLEQKSSFLDTKEDQHAIRSQELSTKLGVYRNLLDRLQRNQARASDPQLQSLVAQQTAARQRMQNTMNDVDATLDALLPTSDESKYATEYSANLGKIDDLKKAIKHHVASADATLDGRDVSREDYVRQLIFDIEAEQSLLHQEQDMIGLMARLVALDAQAFENELTIAGLEDNQQSIASMPLGNAVDFFTNP